MDHKLKKGFKQFMQEANQAIASVEVDEAMQWTQDPAVQFIDVRDRTEVAESGKIVGAEHASRGMLEFLIDPESPYHKEVFNQDKKFVLYCASGGRSALAAYRMKEMGLDNVCTLSGGLKAWLIAGGELEDLE